MQWDDTPNAGFTTAEARPWLPLAADYATRNVAAQEDDPASMLSLFRALTALRRAEPALNRGSIELVDVGIKDVLAYRRTHEGSDGFLVVLNLGEASHVLDMSHLLSLKPFVMVLSTTPVFDEQNDATRFVIEPNQGVIFSA